MKELHGKLKSIQGKTHNNTFAVGINFADRFLCKLALGIGSFILNPEFKESPSADLLRKGMWTKARTDRELLPIRGTGFLGNKNTMSNLDDIFKWTGGHSIVIMKAQSQLAMYTNFYEVNSAVIQISDEPQHWEGKVEEGLIYVISPSLQKAVGPLDLTDYIAHRVEPQLICKPLQDLENEMNKFGDLPPFEI